MSSYTPLNDSNIFGGFDEIISDGNCLTPNTILKKSSLKHFDDKGQKLNRGFSEKSVVIIENNDFMLPNFNLKEGEAIEMITFNEETKEYEFAPKAVEVFLNIKNSIF